MSLTSPNFEDVVMKVALQVLITVFSLAVNWFTFHLVVLKTGSTGTGVAVTSILGIFTTTFTAAAVLWIEETL